MKEKMLLVECFDILSVLLKNTLSFCFVAKWGEKDHIIQKLFADMEFNSVQF